MDTTLSLALKQFDQQNDKNYVFEIPMAAYSRSRMVKEENTVRTNATDNLGTSTG
jgi:hypothetical protein